MSITDMIETGSVNPLVLFAVALMLGALHGLEPGHSKTMIAAYIIAVKGTVKQAVLLGASAAFSHSIIVWILAFLALYFGNELIGEQLEPWFMMVSGVLVLGIAVWMLWRGLVPDKHHHHDHDHGHSHSHGHTHSHNHGEEHSHAHAQAHAHAHSHSHALEHVQHHSAEIEGLDEAHMDAHARAHASELRSRLSDGRIGTWQTVLFGLTGGLIPCPAAITVFLLCLHLGQLTLGITLVSAFSIGLALTLVGIGIAASLGMGALMSRSSRMDRVMTYAPWISAALIAAVGVFIIWSGYSHLGELGHSHDGTH